MERTCWRGEVRLRGDAAPGCKQEQGQCRELSLALAATPSPERPEVRVSGMEANEILTLSCRAHGFYPQPISISWLKDGMVQEQETQRGSTVPNSDGTYHALATIDVLPGDWDKYQCRVEHASLPQPGLFSWGEPSSMGCMELGCSGAPPSPADGPNFPQSHHLT